MEALVYAYFFVLVALSVFAVFILIKTAVSFRNHMKILKAIDDFADDDNYEEALRIIWEMEDLSKTLWRLWDWGRKNILPKDDYELIKPYIH